MQLAATHPSHEISYSIHRFFCFTV